MKTKQFGYALVLTAAIASSIAMFPPGTPSGTSGSDETPWIADYDSALKRARSEGKDLLIDFTGSDWCGWCIRLHDEVFSKPEFLAYANEKFVLVALDYPRKEPAKSRVPHPDRNQELLEQFGITGFPSILLMTSEGDVYGRTSYQPGGPVVYVEHLTKLRSEGRAPLISAIELVREFEAAKDSGRRVALLKILEVLEGLAPESTLAERLDGATRAAFELDPENAEGLKLRATKALLAAGRFDQTLVSIARELDPSNSNRVLELAVFGQFRVRETEEDLTRASDLLDALTKVNGLELMEQDKVLHMLVNAAIWNQRYLDDSERAKGYARRALDYVTDDEKLVSMLSEIIEG